MSRKESNNDFILKELGSLQEKVLFFLAENPENHKQAIQKGIDHPPEQYGSVLKAVNALEKIGYIESRTGFSEKKVEIKIYRCTEEGVFYTLAKNPFSNMPKVLDAYKSQSDLFTSFRALYDIWGHETFVKFFKYVGEFLSMIHKNGVEKAIPFIFMKMVLDTRESDPKTRERIARATLKQFPHLKQTMKEWTKIISKVTREDFKNNS